MCVLADRGGLGEDRGEDGDGVPEGTRAPGEARCIHTQQRGGRSFTGTEFLNGGRQARG